MEEKQNLEKKIKSCERKINVLKVCGKACAAIDLSSLANMVTGNIIPACITAAYFKTEPLGYMLAFYPVDLFVGKYADKLYDRIDRKKHALTDKLIEYQRIQKS